MRLGYFPLQGARWWLTLSIIFIATLLNAQTRNEFTGKVTDATGEPLIGVSIYVNGTVGRGTISDIDGTFTIQAETGEELVFTYTGYGEERRILGDSYELQVALREQAELLDEVVVVGYGKVKKSDLTGAVARVSAEDLTKVATPDVVQALQGRAAGVDVTTQSGEPGGGVRIRIRGTGTINNSNPLYVVDGFQTFDISFLNPNDISSIEILKDASATAIYGSRGANGVVLISTKRGGQGTPKFEVSAYSGIQEAWNTIDMVNANQYAMLRKEAYANDGVVLDPDGDILTRLNFVEEGGYEGTDWQDEVLRQGFIQNYSLSVSGGTEINRYLLSATYFEEEGIVKNSEMEKFFVRFNNDLQLSSWLKAGLQASYVNTRRVFYNGDLFNGVLPLTLRADPLTPAWDETTNNWGRADLSFNNNPARIVDEMKNNRGKREKLVTNVFGEATIIPGLSFRSQFGADLTFINNNSFYPEFFITTDEARDQSTLTENRGRQTAWVWSNYFTYDRQLGSHHLNLVGGAEWQQGTYQDNSVTGFNVPEDEDLRFLSAAKEVDFIVTSNQSEESLQSYFGRVNYAYDNRYLLTVNLRYDGSSRFLGDNRWGFFPSFSVGWNLGREAFLANSPIISDLKIRGGWGQVGNQNSAANYGYVTTVTQDQLYVFNDQIVQGFTPTELSNPELKWETSEMTNIGIDAGLFEDRLLFTADYFIRQTSDMIVPVPIPRYVGAAPPRVNAGDMENQGIELSLSYRNYDSPFKWEVAANFTKITNEITDLGGGEPIAGGFIGKVGNTTRTEEGYEIAYFYGLATDGIFNNQAELDGHVNNEGDPIQPNAQLGDVKYMDTNGDGVIDENDRQYLGSGTPDFSFGLSGNIAYRGFDLSIFFQGTQGNEIVNAMTRFTQASDGFENMHVDRLNRWTPENPNSNEPRMTSTDLNRNIDQFSDRYVEDGSFIRLRNVQLGYSLPGNLADKLNFSNLRVYVAVDNLLTITNYSGWDPEIGELFFDPLFFGVDQANYPQPRRWRVGLDMRF